MCSHKPLDQSRKPSRARFGLKQRFGAEFKHVHLKQTLRSLGLKKESLRYFASVYACVIISVVLVFEMVLNPFKEGFLTVVLPILNEFRPVSSHGDPLHIILVIIY